MTVRDADPAPGSDPTGRRRSADSPRLLREKVARGELGRKTGQGFYPWQ